MVISVLQIKKLRLYKGGHMPKLTNMQFESR